MTSGHEYQRTAPACWSATLRSWWGAPGDDLAVGASPDGKREPADWPRLFTILAKAGYRGFVSLEIEPYDPEGAIDKYGPELVRATRNFSGL